MLRARVRGGTLQTMRLFTTMNPLTRIARLLAAASMFLLPGAVCLPLGATGCTGCECAWEGGQSFHLSSATREGDRVYLDLQVNGFPCCEGGWDEEEIVRIDFSGYAGGSLPGTPVDDMPGTELPVGPDERLELADLGWALQTTDDLFSVLDSVVRPIEIISLSSGKVVGKIRVPAGPAIH